MARRYDCPREGYEECYIELPDEWQGKHSYRYDEATAKADKEWSASIQTFSVALALLDDWRLPGLEGNPEAWDFGAMSLSIIGWVNGVVIRDYMDCFVVPKVSPSLSQNGQKVTVEAAAGN
jgi:hypothetical protein